MKKVYNVWRVTTEFKMVTESLWDVWEQLNKSPHRPFTNVSIDKIDEFTSEVGEIK